MITLRADTRRLRRKLDGIRRETKKAGPHAAGEVASVVCQMVTRLAPRDTGRYSRSWAFANNKIPGVRPMPLPGLQDSRYARLNRSRLIQQAQHWTRVREEWQRRVAGIERRRGHERWPSYHQAKGILRKVQRIEQRALEQVEAIDQSPEGRSAIVIGGSRGRNPLSVGRLARANVGGLPLASVTVRQLAERSIVEVVNKEPHARMVEKRTGVLRGALMLARPAGLVAGRNAYLGAIKRGMRSSG